MENNSNEMEEFISKEIVKAGGILKWLIKMGIIVKRKGRIYKNKWIITINDDYTIKCTCTECKKSTYLSKKDTPIEVGWFYCPYCGKKLVDDYGLIKKDILSS